MPQASRAGPMNSGGRRLPNARLCLTSLVRLRNQCKIGVIRKLRTRTIDSFNDVAKDTHVIEITAAAGVHGTIPRA